MQKNTEKSYRKTYVHHILCVFTANGFSSTKEEQIVIRLAQTNFVSICMQFSTKRTFFFLFFSSTFFFLLFSEKRNLKHFLNKKTVIKTIYFRLENAAIVAKSDMSASKLRYEQQVYNLQTEISSQQVNRRNLCF